MPVLPKAVQGGVRIEAGTSATFCNTGCNAANKVHYGCNMLHPCMRGNRRRRCMRQCTRPLPRRHVGTLQHGAQCCAMSCCVCRHVALYFQVSYCVVTRRTGDLGLSGTSVAAAARAEVKAAPREERVQSVADHKLGSVRTATRCDVAQRPCCRAAQRIAMQHEVLQHSRTCCTAVLSVVGWQSSAAKPRRATTGVGCAVPIAGSDEAGRPLPLPSAKRASFSRAIPH